MTNPTLESIFVYPVKGFPGLQLAASQLNQGAGLPQDRRYAVTRGVEATGDWMPAASYYINARVDGMLKFSLKQSGENAFIIENPAGQTVTIRQNDPQSLEHANETMADFMGHAGVAPGNPPPELVERRDSSGNWDYPDTPISIINAATVEEIGRTLGHAMKPLRYRGNLVIAGLPAWEEFGWKGMRLKIGEAELEVMRPVVRCPTPGVNPETGERDIDFAAEMPEHYGHAYCGMYAVVTKTGTIKADDHVDVLGKAEMPVAQAAAEAEDYRLWPRLAQITFCEKAAGRARISLAPASPWPFPQASPGQRVRFHLGPDEWTSEYIAATSPGHYHFEVEKSETGDPVTEKLRTGMKTGEQIVISGPFGRV